MAEPLDWWKKWRELMGNAISNKEAYSVIAEMMVLDDLYVNDNTIEWTAVNAEVMILKVMRVAMK